MLSKSDPWRWLKLYNKFLKKTFEYTMLGRCQLRISKRRLRLYDATKSLQVRKDIQTTAKRCKDNVS